MTIFGHKSRHVKCDENLCYKSEFERMTIQSYGQMSKLQKPSDTAMTKQTYF